MKDTNMELRLTIETIAMPDQFPIFEVILKKRGRAWRWCVCATEGQIVMQGSERRRPAAKYQAGRALFQLLLWAPYRSTRLSNLDGAGYDCSGRTRSPSEPR
jgi:hypothetical protein